LEESTRGKKSYPTSSALRITQEAALQSEITQVEMQVKGRGGQVRRGDEEE
jgi:hypothetical protein